jgi:hypothetical protein
MDLKTSQPGRGVAFPFFLRRKSSASVPSLGHLDFGGLKQPLCCRKRSDVPRSPQDLPGYSVSAEPFPTSAKPRKQSRTVARNPRSFPREIPFNLHVLVESPSTISQSAWRDGSASYADSLTLRFSGSDVLKMADRFAFIPTNGLVTQNHIKH